jgi:large subunit ribosomal protein L21
VASEPQALPAQYEPSNAPVEAGYQVAPQSVFAVVEVGGTQYKVTPDDVIVTEKLEGVDINEKLRLKRVLLLGSTAETVIGRPYVPGAEVVASVEEHFLDGKVLIFHKRRRKNSRRLNGHRQPLTRLRILSVHGIEEESVVKN